LPGFASVTVTATSAADPTARASNTITVRYSIPTLSSLSPNSLSLGTCQTVRGCQHYRCQSWTWRSFHTAHAEGHIESFGRGLTYHCELTAEGHAAVSSDRYWKS
jgi:hypothetical protein